MPITLALVALFAIFIAPIIVGGEIAAHRNRNIVKGRVVGLFGWLAVLCLWLGLKRRHPTKLFLY